MLHVSEPKGSPIRCSRGTKDKAPRDPETALRAIEPPVAILYGMGGCGKTQLALKYCRNAEEKMLYNSIFWVDASHSKSVARSFAEIESKILKQTVDLTDADASIWRVLDQING